MGHSNSAGRSASNAPPTSTSEITECVQALALPGHRELSLGQLVRSYVHHIEHHLPFIEQKKAMLVHA